MDSPANTSFEQSGVLDPFEKAHTYVENISQTLQQNSAAVLSNAALNKEILKNLTDAAENALETAKLTTTAFLSNPESFTDPATLCVALTVMLKSARKEVKDLNEQVAVSGEENNGLRAKLESSQAAYDSLFEEMKKLQAQSAAQRAPLDLKSQLTDANERIKLQNAKNTEEVNSLKAQIDELKEKAHELEGELVQAQADTLKQKRECEHELKTIADAFEVQETTSKGILDGIRGNLSLPENSDNLNEAISQKIRQGSVKYTQIISKFSVPQDTKNAASDIRAGVENNYKKTILARLRTQYYFSKEINDIIKAVHAIVGDKGIVEDLVESFQLPEDTTHETVVDAIKDKLNETTMALDENTTLKEENDMLKEAAKKNQMLLDLMNEEPVVYEVMAEDEQFNERGISDENFEDQMENDSVIGEETENLTRIDNIEKELEEAQKSLKEYEDVIRENQERIEELTNGKDKAVANAKKETRAYYKNKINELAQIVDQLASNEDVIKTLKKKNRQLQRKEEKSRTQLSDIQSQLQNETAVRESMQEELDNATQQLQSYANENTHLTQMLEQSQASILAAPQTEEEKTTNERIQQVIIGTSEQLQTTSEELREEAEKKNKLLGIVNKQQQVIVELEKLIQKKEEELANSCMPLSVREIPEDQVVDEGTYIESLVDVDKEGIEEEVEKILQIAKEDASNKDKCINVIQYLLGRIAEAGKEQGALKEQIDGFEDKQPIVDKLVALLHQQLLFVERIACTDDKALTEDIRNQMTENAARAHAYIKDNCSGIAEDPSLYDQIGINADPLELKNGVQKLFEEFQEIESPEGIQLLVVLRQAIAAALVLRRYATEAQQQCDRNANEIKILKSDIASFRTETESRANAKVKECEELVTEHDEARKAAEEKLLAIESILRTSVENAEAGQPVSRCLDLLQEDDELFQQNGNVLVATEKEVQEMKDAYSALEAEKEELVQRHEEEMEQINSELSAAKEEIEQTKGELESREEELDKAKMEIEQTKGDLENAMKDNEELQASVEQEKNRANQAEQEKAEEIGKLKERSDAKLNKAIKILASEQKTKIDKMQQRIKSIQRQLNKRNAEIEEKDEIIKSQIESQSQLDITKTQFEEELKETQEQNEAAIQQLRSQIQEANERVNATDLEKKLLESKLKTAEEKIERSKSHFESQLAVKKFAADAETQQKLEALEDSFNEKNIAFLRDICNTFNDHVDLTIPMTQPNVLRMLENVAQEMKLGQRSVEKSKDFERQIKEIRVLVGASKGIRTTAAVSDLVESDKHLKQKNAELEKTVKDYVLGDQSKALEWEDWARKLFDSISQGTQKPSTTLKLRVALEEALYASTANSAIANKLEFLRTQKRLLEQNETLTRPEDDDETHVDSFLALTCAMMFIRRIKRISNHIPSEISYAGNQLEEMEQKNENDISEKNVPKEAKSISALFGQSFNK